MCTEYRDDGLVIPEVKWHSLRKYELIKYYAEEFATSMKNKWPARVFIDLFAGAGLVKVEGEDHIRQASSLLALNVKDPFNKYIFSEFDVHKIQALEERTRKYFPDLDVVFIQGDSNENIQLIIEEIAEDSLSFCVVDPYKIKDIKFDTAKILSKRRVDVLVLVPTHMDIHRNEESYYKAENRNLSVFLGNDNWREEWKRAKEKRISFGDFALIEFGRQMESLGYLNEGLEGAIKILHTEKRFPLYYLSFYSKHSLGMAFWRNAREGTDPQQYLF